MRRRMAQKWRNRLNAAERRSLPVRRVPPSGEALERLLAAEAAQRRARGYRALPPAFVERWLAAGAAPSAQLWIAGSARAPAAGMLFLTWPGGAAYHLGWSGEEGRRTQAHHLILWHAMCDLARARCRTLDLGSLDTVNAPGLARFKLGSGAVPRRFGATCLLLNPC